MRIFVRKRIQWIIFGMPISTAGHFSVNGDLAWDRMPSYIPDIKIIIKNETAVTNTFSQVRIPAPIKFLIARLKSID